MKKGSLTLYVGKEARLIYEGPVNNRVLRINQATQHLPSKLFSSSVKIDMGLEPRHVELLEFLLEKGKVNRGEDIFPSLYRRFESDQLSPAEIRAKQVNNFQVSLNAIRTVLASTNAGAAIIETSRKRSRNYHGDNEELTMDELYYPSGSDYQAINIKLVKADPKGEIFNICDIESFA